MDGRLLSEGQVRAHLDYVSSTFKGHGKILDYGRVKEFIIKRLEQGAPYLGELFSKWEEKDYKTLLQVLEYEENVAKSNEKKVANSLNPEVQKPKNKQKPKKKQKPKNKQKPVDEQPRIESIEIVVDEYDSDELDL